jgi:uncharacterized protein (DUF433 family)
MEPGNATESADTRLQIELAGHHRRLLQTLGDSLGGGGDAAVVCRVLDIVENLVDRIRQGYKLIAVPLADDHPDAIPELTRALRPELSYTYLVARAHAWRKQLVFKGRRLTVGQFLSHMRAEGSTPEQAAADFDLPVEAAYEALEYGERHASLIAAEEAEDAHAVRSLGNAAP